MKKEKKHITIALATGGTGGHIFPAQALIEEIKKSGNKAILICDQRTSQFLNGELARVDSLKIFAPRLGGNLIGFGINSIKLIHSVFKIRQYLKKQNVTKVIGFGGYPSFPTMLAAVSLGLEVFIHEQNAVLGRVNRLMQRFAKNIFLSFSETKHIRAKNAERSMFVGNLVRSNILQYHKKPKPRTHKGIVIVALGGSQGAKILSDILPNALKKLPEKMLENISLYQQARKALVQSTKAQYKGCSAHIVVKDFFDNVGELMHEADLIIGRAGASTVTELAVIGRASILIPLKIATDNHQYYNAKVLEDLGAAIIVNENDANADVLASHIEGLLKSKKKLHDMGEKALKASAVNAAPKILSAIIS
jgi:UDP-N-acetylglucosamine--N-acetylmuramyl-(pentapeptide) pyrophosphoryl-undecaprenol N-acetylglucosamine transferase